MKAKDLNPGDIVKVKYRNDDYEVISEVVSVSSSNIYFTDILALNKETILELEWDMSFDNKYTNDYSFEKIGHRPSAEEILQETHPEYFI